MFRFRRVGPVFVSICSSSKLVEPRACVRMPSPRLLSRRFSNTLRYTQTSDWDSVRFDTVKRRRTPGAPLLSAEEKANVVACRQAIEEGESPETLFRSKLDAGTLSRPVASICLVEANHRNQVAAKLGQAALTWLWDQRDDLIYPDDNDLVFAMTDLLVREGNEEEVWDWIRCRSHRSKDLPFYVRHEWRATALKGLVMSKTKLSTNGSLDEAIEAFLRSGSMSVPDGGSESWLKTHLSWFIPLQAHERSPSINGGRRWTHSWPNTNMRLYHRVVVTLISMHSTSRLDLAKFAMYHIRVPDPEPIMNEFQDALENPNHALHTLRLSTTMHSMRLTAEHASDELRRFGRYNDAALLDAAREKILPSTGAYGDRADRESIFAQGKPAKKSPFPKFK
ncbi:unnamed protein product [Aureobasidium mustum]|uniref:Uncharacterized protein n=1 Tax=Aureobasidium mustum TaxID=2773714 RepID=A0A9N8K2N3_9PEZI|nr:unnamed protein product [Aureobasidium mustum]